jgi:ArsR family transcriptional regulator
MRNIVSAKPSETQPCNLSIALESQQVIYYNIRRYHETLKGGVMDSSLDTFRADFFRVLAHPLRIKILRLLRNGEKSVSRLQAELNTDSSRVSQHLQALRSSHLLTSRREGTSVFYAIRDQEIFVILDGAKRIFERSVSDSRGALELLDEEEQRLAKSPGEE